MANWKKLGEAAWDIGRGLWRTWDPPPELVESVVRNTDIVDTDVNTFIRAGKPAESSPAGLYVPMHPSGTSDPVERLYWNSLGEPDAIPLRHSVGGPRLDADGLHHQRRPTYDPWVRTRPRRGHSWPGLIHDPGSFLYNVPSFDLPETGYSFGMSRFIPGDDADSIFSTPFLRDYVIKGREDDVGDWMRSMIRSDNPYDRHYFEFLQTNPNSKDYGPLLENLSLDDVTLHHISPDNPMYPKPLSLARTDLGLTYGPRYGERAYIDGIHAHEVLGHSLNNEIGVLGLPFQDVGLRAFASRDYGPYGHMLDEALAHGVDSVWSRGRRLRSGSPVVFDMKGRGPLSQARDSVRFLSDPGKQKYYDAHHGVYGYGKQHKNAMRAIQGGAGLLAAGGLYAPLSKIIGYRDIERGLEASDDSVAGRQLTEWEPWMSVHDKGFRGKGFREEMGPISSGLLDALTFPRHLLDSYRGHWDMEREHQEWINEGKPGKWTDRLESGFKTNVEGLPMLAPIDDPPGRRL